MATGAAVLTLSLAGVADLERQLKRSESSVVKFTDHVRQAFDRLEKAVSTSTERALDRLPEVAARSLKASQLVRQWREETRSALATFGADTLGELARRGAESLAKNSFRLADALGLTDLIKNPDQVFKDLESVLTRPVEQALSRLSDLLSGKVKIEDLFRQWRDQTMSGLESWGGETVEGVAKGIAEKLEGAVDRSLTGAAEAIQGLAKRLGVPQLVSEIGFEFKRLEAAIVGPMERALDKVSDVLIGKVKLKDVLRQWRDETKAALASWAKYALSGFVNRGIAALPAMIPGLTELFGNKARDPGTGELLVTGRYNTLAALVKTLQSFIADRASGGRFNLSSLFPAASSPPTTSGSVPGGGFNLSSLFNLGSLFGSSGTASGASAQTALPNAGIELGSGLQGGGAAAGIGATLGKVVPVVGAMLAVYSIGRSITKARRARKAAQVQALRAEFAPTAQAARAIAAEGLVSLEGAAASAVRTIEGIRGLADRAGAAAAKAFLERWQKVAGGLSQSLQSGLASGIRNFLDHEGNLFVSLRDSMRGAIVDAIAQATVQGALVKGAFGNLLGRLAEGLSSGKDVGALIPQIAGLIPDLAARLEAFLVPLREMLDRVLPKGSFQTGTGYVPETGPYWLHRGEAVVPAGARGAGAGPVHIHLHVGAREVLHEILDELVDALPARLRQRGYVGRA